jgi:hypothetical protein
MHIRGSLFATLAPSSFSKHSTIQKKRLRIHVKNSLNIYRYGNCSSAVSPFYHLFQISNPPQIQSVLLVLTSNLLLLLSSYLDRTNMEIAEWAASQLEYVVTGAKKANQVVPGEEEEELDQKAKNIDFTKVVLAREKKEVEAKENVVVKVLKRFDGYGDSEEAYDPNAYPKVCSQNICFINVFIFPHFM